MGVDRDLHHDEDRPGLEGQGGIWRSYQDHLTDTSHGWARPEKLEECILSDQSPLSSGVDSGQQSPVSPENRKSHRGIKKLWG
ncbi:liprin-beta-2b isoform X2, partial [Lates japonicus]